MLNSKIGLIPLLLSFSLALLTLGLINFLPPKLPLYYSLPWGDSQLVAYQQLLIIPASISLITLLNLLISWQLHPSQLFFKKILLIASLLISLVLTITFLKIILIFI